MSNMIVDVDSGTTSSLFDSNKFPKFSTKEESAKSMSVIADSSSFSDWDDEFASSSEEKVFFLYPWRDDSCRKLNGEYGARVVISKTNNEQAKTKPSSHSLLWSDSSSKISASQYQLLPKDQVKTRKCVHKPSKNFLSPKFNLKKIHPCTGANRNLDTHHPPYFTPWRRQTGTN